MYTHCIQTYLGDCDSHAFNGHRGLVAAGPLKLLLVVELPQVPGNSETVSRHFGAIWASLQASNFPGIQARQWDQQSGRSQEMDMLTISNTGGFGNAFEAPKLVVSRPFLGRGSASSPISARDARKERIFFWALRAQKSPGKWAQVADFGR